MEGYDPLLKSYSRQAPYYDRVWRHYNNATVAATLKAVAWENLGLVLDVGCGTGLLEQEIRRAGLRPRMVGIDLSAGMLQEANKKLLANGYIHWVNATAEELPFSPGTFDAVICANCFHYIRYPRKALNEFRRVLRPTGWLVITDWCDDYWTCKMCDWILRFADRSHFRMYGVNGCERLLTKMGFHVEIAQKFKIGWLWGLMTLRAAA